ncbi:hypothetical protein GEV33_013797 [Tenebrio molitor]|uniref:MD-2-related lipid-recognition domain-containing protein n=1 Tax=Tenebrio molitor TaxID=7067 RepID=A0A8J6H662_TENMO|nr:hypothetical protein GEV33_013797 [Tenebrio molitor]
MVEILRAQILLVEGEQKKKVVLRSLGQCKGQQSLPMVWYDFAPKHDEKTGDSMASIKVRTKALVSEDLSIMFNFWKCDASGNPDSCEQIMKDYYVSDICTYMVAKDQMWTSFMDSFTTPLVCPIKPGVYDAKDMKVTPDFLNYLPVGDALWKVQMDGYDRGKKITCVSVVIQIVPFYVKRS